MIVDAFIFNDELDLLELRCRELQGVVDYHLLIESDHTFTRKEKPTYYANHRERFRQFPILTQAVSMPHTEPFANEHHQRQYIEVCTRHLHDNDIVIFTDADEIPSADAVKRYQAGTCTLEMLNHYYWLNCRCGNWGAAKITKAQYLRGQSVSQLRHREAPKIVNGGWHYSYLGGPEVVTRKLNSFAHQGDFFDHFNNQEWMYAASRSLLDLFRRPHDYWLVPIDKSFPAYIKNNAELPWIRRLWADAMFHEKWLNDAYLLQLHDMTRRTMKLPGQIVDIGCWEGKSTICMANAYLPRRQIDVLEDWQKRSPAGRNVHEQFTKNIKALTDGNVNIYPGDPVVTLKNMDQLALVHLDELPYYERVYQLIYAVLPKMVAGGIICGDDFLTAHQGRHDLRGGVEKAVRELLPGFQHKGNFWWYQTAPTVTEA